MIEIPKYTRFDEMVIAVKNIFNILNKKIGF